MLFSVILTGIELWLAIAQSPQKQTETLIPIGCTWCWQELSSVPVLRSAWGRLARPKEGSSGHPWQREPRAQTVWLLLVGGQG